MSKKIILAIFLLIICFILGKTSVLAAGPAGVETDLQLWLSANSGTKDSGGNNASDSEAVVTWEDQSTANRDASKIDGTGATFNATGLNYNPTLVFSGSNNYSASDTGLASGDDDRAIFIVATLDDINDWRYVFGLGTFGSSRAFDFGNRSGSGSVFITTHSGETAETGSWQPTGSARLAYGSVSSNQIFLSINGASLVSGSTGINTVLDGTLNIGSNSQGNEYWDGNISEVIFYNRSLTATEQQRIYSYLALKYGFSLDQTSAQSYLASGSNLMWDKDATDASTYDNGLFGIGRDDSSSLAQIKSRGQTSTNVIILEAISEGSNGSGSFVDMDNLEFLVIGDNNGAASWTTTGAPSGYSVLTRRWKKQEQGNVGEVRMDFDVADSDFNIPAPLDADDYYFVYDTDNDGSLSDETPVAMSDQGSNLWRTTVDFGSGGLFTLASTENPAINTLSPADNATSVTVSSNLVITFSQSVSADSGNIVIKKTSDDSIVETIPANGSLVTGTGSTTITINPTSNLSGSTGYYVVIDSNAFKNGSNFFGGISSKDAWNFTTETLPTSTPTNTPVPTSVPSSSQSSSSSDSNQTSSVCTDQTPSSAPNLFQISTSINSATVYFSPVSPSNAYIVSYGPNSNADMYAVSFDRANNGGVVSYTINSLATNTTYYFKVQAKNGCQTGSWSRTVSEKTTGGSSNLISNFITSSLSRGNIEVIEKEQITESKTPVKEPMTAEPTATPAPKLENTTRADGYDVIVSVVNDGKPVEGATVEVHSTPRRAKTDKDGIARFIGVEGGDHTVYIAYSGYKGEEKVTLNGEEKMVEINLKVELKPSNLFFSPIAIGIILLLILIIFFLLWKKRKKKNSKD